MEHFRSLNDVQAYVLANGRDQLEVLYRRNAIHGDQSRAWAKAWLDRDEVRNTSYMSGMEDLRRMQDEAESDREQGAARLAAESAAAKARMLRYALYLLVLSGLALVVAVTQYM